MLLKIGIFVTARLGSKRLENKHLQLACGKTILSYLLSRISNEFHEEIKNQEAILCISTSNETLNLPLVEVAREASCQIFQGSIHNIPLRHLENAKKLSLDSIVSVDGDDILCCPKAMRSVYNELKNYKEYAYTQGLPLGMNASGYSKESIQKSLSHYSETCFETGWGRVFDTIPKTKITLGTYDLRSNMRFTLDYQDDLLFFRKIISGLLNNINTTSTNEIIEYCLKNDLFKINENLAKEYWENFYRELDAEN